MKLEIIWSDFAEKQLDEIFEYYNKKASTKVARRLIKNLLNEPKILIKNPFIGQMEDLLQDRTTTYRYLICKNYKIIYSVDQEIGFIRIADIFDISLNKKLNNMDIQARKIEFIQKFLKIQSEEVISRLENILRKEIKS